MGKRKSSATKVNKTAAASGYSPFHGHQNTSMTLREESIGKKKQKALNSKSMLKLDHIKNLALWTNGEASIPSLGAFFGNRLAQTVEALSVPSDPNIFSCQRCESILQPGINCTVRIEKIKAKSQQHKRKKSNWSAQNNVVYSCHFCSYRNLKRGTPKNYLKQICIKKPKSGSKVVVEDMVNFQKLPKTEVLVESSKDSVSTQEMMVDEPSTPIITRHPSTNNTLLELRSKKKNRSRIRKTVETAPTIDAEKCNSSSSINSSMSSKRKRKSWTSLKEIVARSSRQDDTSSFASLKIPFFM